MTRLGLVRFCPGEARQARCGSLGRVCRSRVFVGPGEVWQAKDSVELGPVLCGTTRLARQAWFSWLSKVGSQQLGEARQARCSQV